MPTTQCFIFMLCISFVDFYALHVLQLRLPCVEKRQSCSCWLIKSENTKQNLLMSQNVLMSLHCEGLSATATIKFTSITINLTELEPFMFSMVRWLWQPSSIQLSPMVNQL